MARRPSFMIAPSAIGVLAALSITLHRPALADLRCAFFELQPEVRTLGAAWFGGGVVLASDATLSGALWALTPENVGEGFVTSFRVVAPPPDPELGWPRGFAFVIHDDPRGPMALGSPGIAPGNAGLARSLSIAFATGVPAQGERVEVLAAPRAEVPANDPGATLASTNLSALGMTLIDGLPHDIAIQYAAPLGDQPGTLAVIVDHVPVLSVTLDLRAMGVPDGDRQTPPVDITDADGSYVGFTAGGAGFPLPFTVLDWALTAQTAGCVPPVWFALDWQDGPPGSAAAASVRAVGTQPLAYRWFRNGQPLEDDDPTGRIRGAQSASLAITDLSLADAGRYACLVTGPCGAVVTGEAVIAPCPADMNLDGSLDPDDLADYIGAFFADAPAADINLDGTLSPDDVADFIGLFFGACQ